MKKIETLYCVMNEDSGDEAIASMSSALGPMTLQMQAATSNMAHVMKSLALLREQCPGKHFWIIEFKRVSE